MKGLIFTELLAMADKEVGEDRVDSVIQRCPLSGNGAYSTVGNYPSADLFALVKGFSRETGLTVEALQNAFGHHMLSVFSTGYPHFFTAKSDAFELLASVEEEIHVEVKKLHPDTDLPTFQSEFPDEHTMRLTYRSRRGLVDFCEGLIEATLAHYGETASISRTVSTEGHFTVACFTIVRDPS
ncbi:heme NO-binding domain-containing protein [Ponticaulis sp.]|uniref:heme NO-binding domain-containing protein n=1 Tax=Ponticaulis sp. TaxID=2020902 RepID=UPI000B636319|nr:heme NO-binding domain-containing protein [Ponticaulis sp.]MAI88892.1 guanylate cyclase [Ponticaulis sp.]OUY01583.1 MAG: hypothetical protein CBB65_00235 [Hyphomonadaceae bacterium TMED5]